MSRALRFGPAFLFAAIPALLAAQGRAADADASATAAADTIITQDWAAQDALYAGGALQPPVVRRPIDELGRAGRDLAARFEDLMQSSVPASDPRWLDLYRTACDRRREARLAPHLAALRRVVFTKHFDMGGSHYAYTEGQSDAQAERHFQPGSALCILQMAGRYGTVRTLIDDPKGVIRDPDVSYDGGRILFAWKKSDREDDYHLYEMTVADGQVRQLTSGLGFADYEGAYLPGGDIIFNSTRCVQTVDCWWTEVSNFYTCDRDGRYLRRLGFDQVHTNFPTVTPDGRILYTRWEYNDRGQIFPQGLFQMYTDGTAQAAVYGNNSWFPTTILHARAIPGTDKIVSIFTGHHTRQNGWLGILDLSRGREEAGGAQLIAPVRPTEAVRIDKYGQTGDQFQYPYPLSETEFLVTMRPAVVPGPLNRHFAIYWVAADGRRELLARDAGISCNQPIPLAARPPPPIRPSMVDYRKSTGTIFMQDVYAGPGLAGVPRGTIRSLRVVALEYRAAGVGSNHNGGPAGGALISTPISIQGAWDVKIVLGTAPVYEDGSACFVVPARTPVYFQALDEKGRAVQTMRSWTTLQPGENQSCVGCHETRNSAPPVMTVTQAMRAGPQLLRPASAGPRGFSFQREIQPILDRHCTRCHYLDEPGRMVDPGKSTATAVAPVPAVAASAPPAADVKPSFSLAGAPGAWSPAYRALANRRVSDWVNPQSEPSMLPPYSAGAVKSKLISILDEGHYGAKLPAEELDRIAMWIDLGVPCFGDYAEGLQGEGLAKYRHFLQKRRRWQAQEDENISEYIRHLDESRESIIGDQRQTTKGASHGNPGHDDVHD